jgi:HSP20 family protein
MSFWDEWFRKRKRRFISPFDEIDEMIEDFFKDVFESLPQDLFKEQRLPDGSTIRTLGPFVYGYSMTIGPDGKPVIREFGNTKPTRLGIPKPGESREPLVDVIEGEKVIQVVAELPGVDKSDIKLDASDRTLKISVDAEKRKYRKEIDLPARVDPDSAKATYKNGILEVILDKVEKRPPGKTIRID